MSPSQASSARKPRTKQTARRGDHAGFMARIARETSKKSEDPSLQTEEAQPRPRKKQTARRGGNLATPSTRSPPSDLEPSSSNEEQNGPRTRKKQTARRGGPLASNSTRSAPTRITKSTKTDDWDITGDWEIECEDLSDFFPGPSRELSMEISHDTARPGSYMATFDFSVIEGIMRISCPNKRKKTDRKLKGTYVYRGRETGEGMIDVGADRATYEIEFKNMGRRLEGEFEGYAVGSVRFTGEKVGKGAQQRASSAAEWASYSEEAYEEARVDRWK
ncbi:hypothetical protein BST61_g6517 [Cercospora zeina]